jgi:predicted HTH transcriptional regulator
LGFLLPDQKGKNLAVPVQTIEPYVQDQVRKAQVQGKTVLCIECPAGKQKSYTVSGSIIIRNGTNSKKITSEERRRVYFRQPDSIFFNEVYLQKF